VPAIEPEGAQGVWRRDFVRKMYRKMPMAINVITGYFYGIIMIIDSITGVALYLYLVFRAITVVSVRNANGIGQCVCSMVS
jgi:hypothetical protein